MGWTAFLLRALRGHTGGGLQRQRVVGAPGGDYQSLLDREVTADDLDDLRRFVAGWRRVEFYVEPETTAADTTTVAVAFNGEWIRRRVGSPAVARDLADELGVPLYDGSILGCPATLRSWRRSPGNDPRRPGGRA